MAVPTVVRIYRSVYRYHPRNVDYPVHHQRGTNPDLVASRAGRPAAPAVQRASLRCTGTSGEVGGDMVAIDLLGIYLNDHLGGSIAGVEVAEKLRSKNEGTPFGAALDAQLAATDFDGLAERARRQRETLEPFRLQAAAFAFSGES